MNKNDIYKLFAIGLVVIFAVEMVALGAMSGGSSNNGANGNTQANSTGINMLGTVHTNLTIGSYSPYIIVKGSGPAVDAAKKSLIDRGIVTYTIPNGGSLIVNLNTSKDAVAAAAEFARANATATTQIAYIMPQTVQVVGTGISTVADGVGFRAEGTPIYDEGAKVPVTFSAQVEGGIITGIGSLNILPESFSSVLVSASLKSAPQTVYSVEVPWESRTAAKQIVSSAGATYKQKSYAIVASNATSSQLDAIKIQPYITATQPGVVSVGNNFTNISRAQYDLELMRLAPIFPPSVATFANDTGNQKATALAQALQDAGISATLAGHTTATVKLPGTIEYDGRKFYTGGQEIELEVGNATVLENASSINLILDFDAAGSTISRLTSVTQAAG